MSPKSKITIEFLDNYKDLLRDEIFRFVKGKNIYLDLRLGLSEGKYISAINGSIKDIFDDYNISLGVRVFAKKKNCLTASGFCGSSLGIEDFSKIRNIVRELFKRAYVRSLKNSENKTKIKDKYSRFSKNLKDVIFADIEVFQDTVEAEFLKNPRDLCIEDFSRRIEKLSTILATRGIVSNNLSIFSGFHRQIFASSEGSLIDQSKAISQFFIYVAAKGKTIETYYDSFGAYAGLEVFEGFNSYKMDLEGFANYIADGTLELANAPAFNKLERDVPVITDPSYNALLCHEIIGHPSEADRALKREAAWAGRSWWFRSMDNNYLGKKVASDKLSVFSDPGLREGYGYYKYDDEGVKAKKIYNIKNGILEEFLNSRESAFILGREPNGAMRASSSSAIPIIRMNNTCFDKGDYSKEELFSETKNGYYAFGMKTPSIGEKRQNFRISCWKLYKIEKGELTQLYRMGSLMADSYKFLNSIDAVADDFVLYNIPNCGKGTPMQVMMVGNGGPHLRARANVLGANML